TKAHVEKLPKSSRLRLQRIRERTVDGDRWMTVDESDERTEPFELRRRRRRAGRGPRHGGRLGTAPQPQPDEPAPLAVHEREVLMAEGPREPLGQRDVVEAHRHVTAVVRPTPYLRAGLECELLENVAHGRLGQVNGERVVGVADDVPGILLAPAGGSDQNR